MKPTSLSHIGTVLLAPLLSAVSSFVAIVAWGWIQHAREGGGPLTFDPERIVHRTGEYIVAVYLCCLVGLLVLGVPVRLALGSVFPSRWVDRAGAVIGSISGTLALCILAPGRDWTVQAQLGVMYGGLTGFWWGLLLERLKRVSS